MATSTSKAFSLMRSQIVRYSTLYSRILRLNCLPFRSLDGALNVWKIQTVTYAKKAGKGSRSIEPKEVMQVSTDPNYLVAHCSGANYFKEGEDVKLGPDDDYPDWLWDLHIGPPLTLEEMSQDTPQYWRKLRKMHMRRNNRLAKMKKF